MTLTASARVVAVADGHGRTRLPVLGSVIPLVLRRTPDAVYLVGGAAWPLGGDDLSLSLDVGPGASLRLCTAAASVALPGLAGGESVFRITATVGDGATLEYLPEPTVIADGARHRTEISITLAGTASLLLRDEVILGRYGELGGSCVTRLSVNRAGRPLLRHETAVRGDDEVSVGPAVLAGHRMTGSLLIVGACSPPGSRGEGVAVMPLAEGAALVTAVASDAATLRRRLSHALPAHEPAERLQVIWSSWLRG
jgi:urease accessory protein